MKARAPITVALLLALAACGPRLNIEEVDRGRQIRVDDEAPDFTLTSSENETVTLSELRGRIVVLYFYPKDETPGCTKEACSFRDNMEKFDSLSAVVLGISLDTAKSHEKFTKAHKLNFPLLSDPDGKTATAYGAWKKGSTRRSALSIDRSTFVIDGEGTVRWIWRDVGVVGHADEVLEFVETL